MGVHGNCLSADSIARAFTTPQRRSSVITIMSDHEPPPLLGTRHFRVLIGTREVGVCDVSRISSETDLTLPRDEQPHSFETVILRRALSSSTELFDWRTSINSGKDDRRPVTIHQLDSALGRVVNSWLLESAWPRRWSGPTFAANGNEIAMEELELAYDGVVWLASPDEPRSDVPRSKKPHPSKPRPNKATSTKTRSRKTEGA